MLINFNAIKFPSISLGVYPIQNTPIAPELFHVYLDSIDPRKHLEDLILGDATSVCPNVCSRRLFHAVMPMPMPRDACFNAVRESRSFIN